MKKWQVTRHGGLRRTGVAQRKSDANTRRRSVVRSHPPVLTIKFREKLGIESCPYLIRWRIETRLGSVRLHHWISHDDARAFHDHPWDFITFVLKGGYTDSSPEGNQHLKAPTVQHRYATHKHTVFPDADGAWTLVLTGPKARAWGFWVAGKFKKANKYFLSHGHHPCA
jgi:hypothetical protein